MTLLKYHRSQLQMETMTSEQIETIWSSISHYVPERQKLDCAIADIDLNKRKVIRGSMEIDEKLTEAIRIVLEDEAEDVLNTTEYGYEDQ